MHNAMFEWRAMSAHDLSAVEAIAAKVHPNFFERPQVFAERLALYRHGAHLLEVAEKPAGYVFSHPFSLGALPKLDTLLGELPSEPDTYYIHDLALLPVVRRIGAAANIVSILEKHARARGFATLSLVAVNDSAPFWARQGFAVRTDPRLAETLLAYEEDARYMVKNLDPAGGLASRGARG